MTSENTPTDRAAHNIATEFQYYRQDSAMTIEALRYDLAAARAQTDMLRRANAELEAKHHAYILDTRHRIDAFDDAVHEVDPKYMPADECRSSCCTAVRVARAALPEVAHDER